MTRGLAFTLASTVASRDGAAIRITRRLFGSLLSPTSQINLLNITLLNSKPLNINLLKPRDVSRLLNITPRPVRLVKS